MPNQPKSPIIAGRVPAELKRWVEDHAESTGRTITDILVTALQRYKKSVERSAKGGK
jgi:hypothetical protein